MTPAHATALATATVQDLLIAEYTAMRADLQRFLMARLRNAAAAEDVYQELFLRLRGAHLPDEIREVRSFVYKAAYNLANEYVRSQHRQQARDASWVDHHTERLGENAVARERAADEVIDARQRLAAVAASIAALPPRCREVFTLCRLRGQSHREVAEALGITTKAVEKQITAALKHLASSLIVRNAPDLGTERGD